MRYTASEKLQIIQRVEQSSLPVRRTLRQLGIRKSTFYGWYRRYVEGGLEALEDQPPRPSRVWNKVPEEAVEAILELALAEPRRSRPGSWPSNTPTPPDTMCPNPPSTGYSRPRV